MNEDTRESPVEAQLVLVSSRYYSPELRRFIQPVDVFSLNSQSVNGLNLYVYCMNNPVNYKQAPVSFDNSFTDSSLFGIIGGRFMPIISPSSGGSSRVDWENGGFQIPIWISSLMSGSDFGASIAPALRTIYQYIRYPGVKDFHFARPEDGGTGKTYVTLE